MPYYCSETNNVTTTADVKLQQTFAFDDSEEQFIVSIRGDEDPSHDWGGVSGLDLSSWLERPILAATHVWEVGDPFPVIYFNPWAHFLESPSVAQKISNFYLMRCKMHMKVIVNGSQMHYGRGFLSYRPLMTEPGERYQYDASANPVVTPDAFGSVGHDTFTNVDVAHRIDTCTMIQSQWPKIFIDPGQSMGGEMEFPFFFGANWFRINKRDWIAHPSHVQPLNAPSGPPALDVYSHIHSVTPDKAYGPYGATRTHMGVVHSTSLAPLKHSNGANDPVTVQIFLWASDVKLSVPTSDIHPDAGFGPPPVSVFRPQSRMEYVPQFLGDLAKPGSDISDRLEFGGSSLQGGSATVGLADDADMSINNIASRECWLSRFVWHVDDPAETPLWMAQVTPQLIKMNWATVPGQTSVDGIPAVTPTPCAYAALPFTYWRGSMTYRIQIVASNLHRGRLRIVYDPWADLNLRLNVNDYPEELMNLQYSRTIDIAGDAGRDFTFSIGYMQPTPYLPLLPLPSRVESRNSYRYENYGTPGNVGINNIGQHSVSTNGAFTIYVLNRLAVPATMPGLNNDVNVEIYASAGSDMDFQMPTSRDLDVISFVDPTGFPPNFRNDAIPTRVGNFAARYDDNRPSRFKPQMDSASMGATEGENTPIDPPEMATIGEVSQPAASMASITFGETMKSWDQLMARWTKYNREVFCETDRRVPLIDRAATEAHMIIAPDFPPFPGPSPMTQVWLQKTGAWDGVPDDAYGWAPTDNTGSAYFNNGINPPPPSKVILNGPVLDQFGNPPPTCSPNLTDVKWALRFNPGNLTMLHFVTRMFIGRKGSLKNKYVLGGNDTITSATGSLGLTVKRLSDSGVITGRGLRPGTGGTGSSMDPAEDSESVTNWPASGGLWDQAYCRYGLAQRSHSGVNESAGTARLQSVTGETLQGTKSISAPNWFSADAYPGAGWHTDYIDYTDPLITSDNLLSNQFDGVHVTTTKQQPVVEVEIPFYMNTRFILNDLVFTNTTATTAHLIQFESAHPATIHPQIDENLTDAALTYLDRYTVPGSDFALYYLANVPYLLLNACHLYETRVGTTDEPECGTVSYGNLRYMAGGRQEISANNTDFGNGLANSYVNRTYYYDCSVKSHGKGVTPVPGNLRPIYPP